jgi:hypothetical protein
MIDTLSAWLESSQEVAFEVIVAGMVSGGLLEDAFHRPTRFELEGDSLSIEFDRGQRLFVADPTGISRTAKGDLLVEQGTEARFSWHPQGAPDQPEAQCVEIYTVTVQGFAIRSRVIDPAFTAGPLDPLPTIVSLGGEGVPFVRLARIAGA